MDLTDAGLREPRCETTTWSPACGSFDRRLVLNIIRTEGATA